MSHAYPGLRQRARRHCLWVPYLRMNMTVSRSEKVNVLLPDGTLSAAELASLPGWLNGSLPLTTECGRRVFPRLNGRDSRRFPIQGG